MAIPSKLNPSLFQNIQIGNLKSNAIGANQYGPSQSLLTATIGKGSLASFSYTFVKPGANHDPYPLVLITDVWPNYIRGINIHYLTFPTIKRILVPNCNNQTFSYANIRNNSYIVSAFRQYKRNGIRQIKKLDCSFLTNVLASVRTFNPNEVEAIRQSIRNQIRQLTNTQAVATNPEQPTQNGLT